MANSRVGTRIKVKNDSRYLFLKTPAGKWDLPGGGLIEGESVEDCARRELFEETGLSVHEMKYLGKKSFLFHGTEFIFHGFLVSVNKSDIILSEEHIDCRWVKQSEIVDIENLVEAKDIYKVIMEIESGNY